MVQEGEAAEHLAFGDVVPSAERLANAIRELLVVRHGILLLTVRVHRHDLRQVTGVRYSGELGHPFHVVDDETVVLPLDHPFVKEGRFASLLVRDRELADSLAEGFHGLWRKAMKNLREIQVDPRGHKT